MPQNTDPAHEIRGMGCPDEADVSHSNPRNNRKPSEHDMDCMHTLPSRTPGDENQASHDQLLEVTSTNSGTVPNHVTSRFRIDAPELENQFKFPPAPRHAPGHFTNRMIVPRVDGSAKQQPPTPGSLASNVTQSEQQHIPSAAPTPSKDPIYIRPVQYPSFVPSPLSVVQTADGSRGCASPKKKVIFPITAHQGTTTSVVQNQASPGGDTQQPPVPVQSIQLQQPAIAPKSLSLQIAAPGNPLPENSMYKSVHAHITGQGEQQTTTGQRISPMGEFANMVGGNEAKNDVNRSRNPEVSAPSGRRPQPSMGQSHTISRSSVLPQVDDSLQTPKHVEKQQLVPLKHDYRRQQVNRPVRDMLRVRQRSQSLSLSGSSSGSGVSKRATTSIHSLNIYRDRDLPEVAKKVNDLWVLCNGAVKDAEKESQRRVEKYRRKLHDRSQRITRYLETIDLQTHAIQTLEAVKQDMETRITSLESESRSYSDMVPKLQDKCHQMKETLDSAIAQQLEQKQLHDQYKRSTQDVIDEMRAEKQREQASREMVERQLAAVREQMKEKVRQVELKTQEECRHMGNQLQQLSRQLDEKDSQLKHENKISENASKQLAQYREEQEALEALRLQTSDILKLLSAQQSHIEIQQVKQAQVEHGSKLNDMTERLQSLHNLITPHDEVVSKLSQNQDQILDGIMSTLQTISEGQSSGKDSVSNAVGQLSAELVEATNTLSDLKKQVAARQECAPEARQIRDDTRQLLEQVKQERLDIGKQLEEVKNQLAVKEQDEGNERTEVKSLRNALSQAQVEIQHLTEGIQKKTAEIEGQQKTDSMTIQTLNDSFAKARKEATDVAAASQSQAEKMRTIMQSLGNWVQNKAAAYGFGEDLNKLWQECEAAPNQGAKWGLYLDKILTRIAFKEEGITAPRPVDLPHHLRPVHDPLGIYAAGARRVIVQSPHAGVITPVPPSVEEEKTQRRGGTQPKPIIKRVTRSSTAPEASQVPEQGIVTASNLVPGYGSFQLHPNSNPRTSGQAVMIEQRWEGNILREDGVQGASGAGQAPNARPPTKIKLKSQSQKRGRKPMDAEAVESFSSHSLPELSQDPVEDDDGDNVPLAKKAKVQAPTARSNPKRAKPASTQGKKQKPASGSAAGIVHGSLAGIPGVVHGAPSQS